MIEESEWFESEESEIEDVFFPETGIWHPSFVEGMPHDVFAMTCRPTLAQYRDYCDFMKVSPSARGLF